MIKALFLCLSLFIFQQGLAQKYIKEYNKGITYFTQKQYDQAILCFKKAIKKKSDFAQAHVQLALLYEEQQNMPLAIQYFTSASELDSLNAYTHFYLGLCLEKEKNIVEGKKHIRRAAYLDSTNGTFLIEAARMELIENQYEKGIKLLDKAQKKVGSVPTLELYYASAYISLEDGANALEHIKKYHQVGIPDNNTYRVQGYAKFLVNDFIGAFYDLEKSLSLSAKRDTLDGMAHFYMGLVLLERDEYSEAISQFNLSINHVPDRAAYYQRGVAKGFLTDYVGALEDLKKCAVIDPLTVDLNNRISWLYLKLRLERQGVKYFTELIETDKNQYEYYQNRSKLYFRLDELDSALQDINTAIQLRPSVSSNYLIRSEIIESIETEKYDEADEEFLESDEDDFLENLGKILLADIEMAEKFAITESEKDDIYIAKGLFFFNREEFDLALAEFQKISENSNEVKTKKLFIGRIYHNKGQYQLAVDNLKLSLNDEAEPFYRLAMAYNKLKQHDQFCFFLKKAVALGYETALMPKCE